MGFDEIGKLGHCAKRDGYVKYLRSCFLSFLTPVFSNAFVSVQTNKHLKEACIDNHRIAGTPKHFIITSCMLDHDVKLEYICSTRLVS